jgi:signal transduction histidine kinase
VEFARPEAPPRSAVGSDTSEPLNTTLADELVGRASALATGLSRRARQGAPLPRRVLRRIDACEARARRLGGGGRELGCAAALDFLGDAVAALAVDGAWAPGEAREAVARAAREIGIPQGPAAFTVYRRALTSKDCAQLPPAVAADLILALLVELGPGVAVSLWTIGQSGHTDCLAAAGKAPRSRRLREAAATALDGVLTASGQVQALIVERWDRPYAALVARTRSCDAPRLDAYLADAAAALAPVLEREALFERNTGRERELVSAGERRLVRLGFDLHDGPLQELVAFAEDLRLARAQVDTLIGPADRPRAHGRFDDLEARLGSLDRELRAIAHSVRSTTARERPLEHALRNELDELTRSSDIETGIAVDGDLSGLTDSQKIVVFRVVQEALANVRKHSGATRATVRIRSTPVFLEVTVSDDGCGFDVRRTIEGASQSDRLGLAGVHERVRLLGGDVEIHGGPGLGTEVRATVPHWRPTTETATTVYAASS